MLSDASDVLPTVVTAPQDATTLQLDTVLFVPCRATLPAVNRRTLSLDAAALPIQLFCKTWRMPVCAAGCISDEDSIHSALLIKKNCFTAELSV